MESQQNYNEEYYRSHCGELYEYNDVWKAFWGNVAERIVLTLCPKRVLDVGCAKGFLVKELRERGVEAYGIDISEYAISQVDESVKEFCRVGSVLEPIQEKYDLITCIEVIEHLEKADGRTAIKNLCAAADDIIFSSTPFDYDEETHVNVRPAEYWAEEFYYHGFLHDIDYDAAYVAVQTMRFKKAKKNINCAELVRQYERRYFVNFNELFHVRLLANHLSLEKEELLRQMREAAQQAEEDKIRREKEISQVQERLRAEMAEEVRREEKFQVDYFALEQDYLALEQDYLTLKEEYHSLEVRWSEDRKKDSLHEKREEESAEELKRAKEEFAHAVEIIQYNEREIERVSALYDQIKNSTCWKITGPLRRIGRIFKS